MKLALAIAGLAAILLCSSCTNLQNRRDLFTPARGSLKYSIEGEYTKQIGRYPL